MIVVAQAQARANTDLKKERRLAQAAANKQQAKDNVGKAAALGKAAAAGKARNKRK